MELNVSDTIKKMKASEVRFEKKDLANTDVIDGIKMGASGNVVLEKLVLIGLQKANAPIVLDAIKDLVNLQQLCLGK